MSDIDIAAVSETLGNDLFGSTSEPVIDSPVPETPELPDQGTESLAPEVLDESAETDVESEANDTATESETVTDSRSGAPKTWRKEAAAEWANLPPTVQAEIAKREEDMFRGLESYKMDAGIGNNFKQIITPHLDHLQRAGVNPYEEINGLLEYGKVMRFGSTEEKMSLISTICSEYGIDLLDLAEHTPASTYTDPAISTLQQRINALESARTQEETNRQSRVISDAQAAVNAFGADPANIYFAELEEDMMALIKTNNGKSFEENLREAYDKAMWSNPITRAKELARQTAESQAQSSKRAEAARKAQSANLKTNARPGSATAPLGSMDDTLKATLDEINSRN